MPISLSEVEHIAELARLQLTEAEKALFAEQLSDILDSFQRLQSVDTEGVPPMTTVVPLDTVLRDDEARPGLPPDELLANAPDAEDDMFRVSAVLD